MSVRLAEIEIALLLRCVSDLFGSFVVDRGYIYIAAHDKSDFFAIRGNCDIGGSACLIDGSGRSPPYRDDLYIHFLRLCTLFDRIDFAIVSVTEVAVVVGS